MSSDLRTSRRLRGSVGRHQERRGSQEQSQGRLLPTPHAGKAPPVSAALQGCRPPGSHSPSLAALSLHHSRWLRGWRRTGWAAAAGGPETLHRCTEFSPRRAGVLSRPGGSSPASSRSTDGRGHPSFTSLSLDSAHLAFGAGARLSLRVE